MMPATRATCSASPFAVPSRTARSVSGAIRTMHSAVASRTVGILSATSTMRAAPFSSRCVNRFAMEHQDMRMSGIDGILFDYGRTLVTFAYPTDEVLLVIAGFRPRIEGAIGMPAPEARSILEDVLLPLEQYIESPSEDEVDYMNVYREMWQRAGMRLPDDLLYEILDAEQRTWDRSVRVDPDALPGAEQWHRRHGRRDRLLQRGRPAQTGSGGLPGRAGRNRHRAAPHALRRRPRE